MKYKNYKKTIVSKDEFYDDLLLPEIFDNYDEYLKFMINALLKQLES